MIGPQCLVPGSISGIVEASTEPVSLARIDPATGVLHEPGHPLDGRCLSGRVLACPGGKGSSSGSYVLLNLAGRGLAPSAIVVEQADAVLIAGAVLANVPLLQGVDVGCLKSGERFAADAQCPSTPTLSLTATARAALDGQRGTALQTAMQVLVAVGEACGADQLVPVASAHVGLSLSSLGEAGVRWLESLAADGARCAVPTTTNVLSFARADAHSHEARLQQRALEALIRMGAVANCSCNPFVQGHGPRRGDAVAWSESATAPFVNGVLGARTNREGATSLASAITGLTPRYGMHLDRERAAGPFFRVEAALDSDARFHLLGAAIGRRIKSGVPAVAGMPAAVSHQALYALSASLAAHSTASMFHVVGVTPEAPDLAALYPDGPPEPIRIGETELAAEQARWVDDGAAPDLVILGCPHASLEQLQVLAQAVQHARVPGRLAFLVHTNREVRTAASRSGALATLESAGVQVTSDTCTYVSLNQYATGTRVFTDSAKMAFLLSTRGFKPTLLAAAECVRAAIER